MPRLPTCFLFIFLQFPLFSLQSQPKSTDYSIHHLTTKQGLPSNKVNSFIKDQMGFMWFATDNGFARFDGSSSKTYQIPTNSIISLNSQVVNQIFEDREGVLWLGIYGQGLMKFHQDNSFTGLEHNPNDVSSLSSNFANVIFQDKEDVIWVGTKSGLNKYIPKSNSFKTFRHETNLTDDLINQIFYIFEDSEGMFWIGTGGGVYLFDRQNKSFSKFDPDVEIPGDDYRKVNCIIEDKDGTIWFGSEWGLFKYEKGTRKIKHYLPEGFGQQDINISKPNSFISNIFIKSILETERNGRHILWIATQWGLNVLDIENEQFEVIFTYQKSAQSLSTNSLEELFLDNNGLLWISTLTSGMEILDTRHNPFHEFLLKAPVQKYHYQANCFLVDKAGDLWVGAFDSGLFHFTSEFNYIGNYTKWQLGVNAFDERQHNNMNSIYQDSDNNLWLGFYKWGLVLFDTEKKVFRPIELINEINAPKPDRIDNIIEDQEGILWIGTFSGLYHKDLTKPILSPAQIIDHPVLKDAVIISIYEDSKNNIWISTREHGLFCLESGKRSPMQFEQYYHPHSSQNGFYGNYVTSIYEDQKGTLWFGSDVGLNRFNFQDEQFEPDIFFNKDHSGHIIRIYSDDNDNLWLLNATEGLIMYAPYSDKNNKVKVFDIRDGLPFDNFNTLYYPANVFYKSSDGRLFISAGLGTGSSFLWYHPDSIKENMHIPQTIITNFKVKNEAFPIDSSLSIKKHITLNYNENFFSFEFAALDFLIPEKNQYAYYLEGLEDNWIYSGNQKTANYTSVSPGEYTFRVKGSNNDGYWDKEGTYIHVTILPPFWLTWWAYLIYTLVFIAIIYSIIHYYIRRQKLLYKLEIEHFEAEKLKEMDSIKNRFFANISHEFRTPLTLILGPLKNFINKTSDIDEKKELSVMQRNAQRLQELINQLLNLSKLEAGKMHLNTQKQNIVSLVKNYIQSFESLAKQRNILLIFNTVDKDIQVYVDREKIEQVLNNLLSNAFKFTEDGGKIDVNISSVNIPLNPPSKGKIPLTSLNKKKPQTPPFLKGAGGIQLTISDTGKGIPSEKMKHIFDRFYQVEDTQKRNYEGTGIGLALVKELVELHHGRILVESREEKGTKFTVVLPHGKDYLKPDEMEEIPDYDTTDIKDIVEHEEKTYPDSPEPEQSLDEEENGLPIMLITEDNYDMRKYIGTYFNTDFRIIEADNGKEGLAKATEQIPNVIISDVMMPEMDGNDFCQKIKTDERTSHIPVILLTARASKESRLEGLETGADDFIIKPFDGEELQVRVKNLIDQRKKLQERFTKNAMKIGLSELMKLSDSGVASIEQKFLQKAITVVEENLHEPEFSIDNFAREMAISRMQLHRKLRALTDQSASKFIRTIRLNLAAQLLMEKCGNITEIAFEVGFNSLSWFTRSFQEQFGMSPKDYITEHNK